MNIIPHGSNIGPAVSRQRGAVLYVALVMLILLALIGIIGLQVTGMQERMASNYRAVGLAFQNTEALARDTECGLDLMNDVTRAGCTRVNRADVNTQCDDGFDVGDWVAGRNLANAPAVNVRQIEGCIIGEADIGMGRTQEEGANLMPIYQISTFNTDTDGNSGTAATAIDTIYKL